MMTTTTMMTMMMTLNMMQMQCATSLFLRESETRIVKQEE
jgi:hypothetical protein